MWNTLNFDISSKCRTLFHSKTWRWKIGQSVQRWRTGPHTVTSGLQRHTSRNVSNFTPRIKKIERTNLRSEVAIKNNKSEQARAVWTPDDNYVL